MAKLTKRELDALNQVIVEKLIQQFTTQANEKLKKHPKYKQFLKLVKEIEELRIERDRLSKLYSAIDDKHWNENRRRRELIKEIVGVPDFIYDTNPKKEIVINNVEGLENKIQNDLVLMNINSDVNVQGLIDQLVEKYSKV